MEVIFQIEYHTYWGQEPIVAGTCSSLGNGLWANAPRMEHKGNGLWNLHIQMPSGEKEFRYKYGIRNAQGEVDEEVGTWRNVTLNNFPYKTLLLSDAWRAPHSEDALLSTPYTSVFYPHNFSANSAKAQEGYSHLLCVRAACVPQDHLLCVTGSDEALGAWNERLPLLMQPNEDGLWQTGFVPRHAQHSIYYRYGLYNIEQKKIVQSEQRPDRLLESIAKNSAVWRTDEGLAIQKVKPRGAGVAIPIFSLRSKNSGGVGEFLDIKPMADWAKNAGLSMIQVLPVNDTSSSGTWQDSYPYSAISVFALHPLYLSVDSLTSKYTAQEKAQLSKAKETLNALTAMDYEKVMQLKWRYISIAFEKEKKTLLGSANFKKFVEENSEWLMPYAAFCFLRDKYKTADFSEWREYAEYSAKKVEALFNPKNADYESVMIHCFAQYHLHTQLVEATTYARGKGVILKGDIPIGISRNSCDAWVAPELYNMNAQAGAPPDAFSTTGQNWGFPTYNWARMAHDGYTWWKQRLQKMSAYFDAFRIDHILGFFRIWEIPLHSVQGLLGYFSPALPLSLNELDQRGAWFDADRLCSPYIRKHVLQEVFGKEAAEVQDFFMEEYKPHCLRFKEAYNTQRKLEDFFAQNKKENHPLKLQLFDLLNDVVLIEDKEQSAHYHPRIAMHYTRSYRDLDEQQKQRLDAIYVDFFYHRHNQFWKEQAMKKLPAVRYATNMLVCGEDLGMVPSCVPDVMQHLSMLSLIIQRMPNDSSVEFASLEHAPYLSVCSPGSHDTSGVREWWEEDKAATQRFYNNVLHKSGEAPATCEPWIANEIIVQHLHAPSMWAVFPLQDLLATDEKLRYKDARAERINVPSNPRHYWRYRMHLPIEKLIKQQEFNQKLKDMIGWARR